MEKARSAKCPYIRVQGTHKGEACGKSVAVGSDMCHTHTARVAKQGKKVEKKAAPKPDNSKSLAAAAAAVSGKPAAPQEIPRSTEAELDALEAEFRGQDEEYFKSDAPPEYAAEEAKDLPPSASSASKIIAEELKKPDETPMRTAFIQGGYKGLCKTVESMVPTWTDYSVDGLSKSVGTDEMAYLFQQMIIEQYGSDDVVSSPTAMFALSLLITVPGLVKKKDGTRPIPVPYVGI